MVGRLSTSGCTQRSHVLAARPDGEPLLAVICGQCVRPGWAGGGDVLATVPIGVDGVRDRVGGMSATPLTASSGVDGVGDRFGFRSRAYRTGARRGCGGAGR